MNLQPLNGHILIRIQDAPTRSAGGLYVPESAIERSNEGVVVAMASEVGKDLNLGDKVLFRKHAGEEITVDGEKLRLLPYADLLARVPQTDAIPA